MEYFAAYSRQIKAFYRTMWQNLFARERNLDGALRDYVMKPGFFWEFLQMHKWFLIAFFRVPMMLLQLAFGYVAAVVVLAIVFFAPLIILLMFPIFTLQRYRRIKREGRQL
jgi:hypothetical protein